MPGDPIINLFGERLIYVDSDMRAFLEAKYGLDKPLGVQYLIFLSTIFTFDFGYSISLAMDVNKLIAERVIWTIALVLPSIIIGSTISLLLAMNCGMNRGSGKDKTLSALAIILHTVPGFLIGMVFLRIFSLQLGWFPLGHLASGSYSGWLYYLDIAYHLILPFSVLTLLIASSQFLILRNSVTQINDDYFIFVARSKGLSEIQIAWNHVLRNILPVFLSMLAMNLGVMISGALLIENVFSLQGMGTLLYEAIKMQDYPLIQAIFIILTFSVLIMNLVAEILYGLADPRVGDSLGGWNK
jgi:peptide/nickel transport system permease protein